MAKKSWLEYLTESTKSLEPPERFFYWSGLATIASIVKKNVFINRFSYNLYPNIYVILVSAKSGLRKGVPISYARSFVEKLGATRVISGQNSIPAMLQELSQQTTNGNGKVYSNAQALLLAPELDSFLIKDESSLTTLTDLYDTHAYETSWKKNLKSGKIELKEPCITLLGASNEVLLEDFVRVKDVEGGFLARTFIVHESKRQTNNSLMWEPVGLTKREELIKPLERLNNLAGVFDIPDPVKHIYNDWYIKISEADHDDRTGTMERIGDSVLKVAMLISLSRSNSLVIEQEDLELSIEKCEETLIGTKKITLGQGKSEVSPLIAQVTKILVDSPNQEILRAKLLTKLNCETLQLDRVIDTLEQRDAIELYRKQGQKGVFYHMKPAVYQEYLRFKNNP